MGPTARRVDQRRTAPDAQSAAPPRPAARRLYVPVPWKLALAQVVALGWLGVSVRLSLPWLGDLAGAVGPVAAVLVVALVAYLPGWLVAFLAASLLLDPAGGGPPRPDHHLGADHVPVLRLSHLQRPDTATARTAGT